MGETAVTREEVRKLIGGYATGTLTEAERKLLFAAALEDQELFDELAGEQVFKDLLEAPGMRARLMTAVSPSPAPRRQSWWAWGALAAAAAAGLILFIATGSRPESAVQVAAVPSAKPQPAPEPEAPPTPPQVTPKGRTEVAKQPGQQENRENAARSQVAASEELQKTTQLEEVADAVAPVRADKVAADTAVAAAAADAPPPPAKPVAQTAAAKGGAGKGGGVGGLVAGPPAPAARARNEAVAPPFSFTYQRTADSLRIVPAAQGVLLVTTGGQTLFPQNSVLAGSNVIIPLQANTGDITVVFAASIGAPSVETVRRETAAGTVADPNSSANSRLAIIVPALQ